MTSQVSYLSQCYAVNVIDMLERAKELKAQFREGVVLQNWVESQYFCLEFRVCCFENFSFEQEIDEITEGVESCSSYKHNHASR